MELGSNKSLLTLKGRVVVVTGGSSGIGAACVRAFAKEGAVVVIGYHRGYERAEQLLKELPGTGHCTLQISLTEIDSHQELAQQLKKMFGKIDVLVNSAGYTKLIPHTQIEELTPHFFNEIFCANAIGPYSIIRSLLPLLEASPDAVVVNVSSVSAFTGSGSNIAYCASKAALDTMTMSLARAFGPPVRFLCVSPAAVDTDFVVGRDRSELQRKAANTPLGRIVTPDDVALSVLACATHLKTATGTRIVIDGGHTL